MDPFTDMKRQLKQRLPNADMMVDRPMMQDGCWWLDVRWNGRTIVVMWLNQQFGISMLDDEAYFTHQPDEIFSDHESASNRICQLLGA